MTGAEERLFSAELLSQPARARLSYFKAMTIKHPSLDAAYTDVCGAIHDGAPGSLILVQGSAGVGKTTLLQLIEKLLTEEMLPELERDAERVAVVRLAAVAPEARGFNWKEYFRRLLLALAEPMVDRKISQAHSEGDGAKNDPRHQAVLDAASHTSSANLRYATEQALRRRRPCAVLLDDAQHLAITGSGRKLLDQLNTLKSVADLTQTTHVLAGTYELTAFRNLSGQLSRRSVDVELTRYRAADRAERQAFVSALWTFQRHLPLAEMPDLVTDWDYFYEHSIGCVGILKDWLTRSLALALRSGKASLSERELRARALTTAQCAKLLAEATEGERELSDTPHARSELRLGLGLEADGKSVSDTPPRVSSPPIRKRRTVGRRRPVRDMVGVERA